MWRINVSLWSGPSLHRVAAPWLAAINLTHDYDFGYGDSPASDGNVVPTQNNEDIVEGQDVKDEVLLRANTSQQLILTIITKQLRFVGHVVRQGKLEYLTVSGRMEGKRINTEPSVVDMLFRLECSSGIKV